MATKRKRKPKSKGLGDTIAKVTKWAGVEPCEACKKRRNKLNKLIPYNSSRDEMTEQQYNDWNEWKSNWDGRTLNDADMTFIEDTYNSVRHTNNQPCRTCSSSGWVQLIKGIDSVADKYK